MNGGGAEREGDTESKAGSRLWAVSPEPDAGLKLTDREIVTWAEVGRLTDWATQAPLSGLDLDVPLCNWAQVWERKEQTSFSSGFCLSIGYVSDDGEEVRTVKGTES